MTKTEPSREDVAGHRARELAQIERGFSARSIQRRRQARSAAKLWLVAVGLSDCAKRAFDILASGALLLLFSPVFLMFTARRTNSGGKLVRSPRLGRWGIIFNEYSFSSVSFSRVPALINVFKGDMSIVGPRPVSSGDVDSFDRAAWKRFAIRPGLLCLWWIRTRSNTAYGNESLADAEYVQTQTFMGDLGIALRALPASVCGNTTTHAPDLVDLRGIPINNLTMEEAIELVLKKSKSAEPSQVCFVNADCANIAWNDKEYFGVLNTCGLVLADGIGIKFAGKILNRNIKQNVNGTDMLMPLCRALERDGIGLFMLGGKPGVAADVAGWMAKTFPALAVRGYRDGYFTAAELPAILETIRHSGAQILLVAFGVPKQEKWIREHLAETGAKVNMGVGGLFDFYSGRIPRAPEWMRELGMEWLYRFWQEPRRMWRRYFIGNLIFVARVLHDRQRNASL